MVSGSSCSLLHWSSVHSKWLWPAAVHRWGDSITLIVAGPLRAKAPSRFCEPYAMTVSRSGTAKGS
jgi:hypothetical protein